MFKLDDLQIELVGLCNCICPHCSIDKRNIVKEPMDKELAIRLLGEANDMDVSLISYHGIGESLLHPDILDIIGIGEQLKFQHRLSTNCFNLKGEIADGMRKFKRLQFILAIPWASKPKFVDKCVENVINYLKSKPENYDIHVQMVCDINAEKYYRRLVDTFLPLVEKIDNVKIHLKQPLTWPDDTPNYGFINYELRDHEKVILSTHATPVSIGNGCSMPERLLLILADGNCTACCISTVSDIWNLGNVKNNSLKDIWNSSRMEEIRKLWRAKDDSLPCGHCKKRTDCLQE